MEKMWLRIFVRLDFFDMENYDDLEAYPNVLIKWFDNMF